MKRKVKLQAIDIGSRHWDVRPEHIRLECDVEVEVNQSHETQPAAIKAAGWQTIANRGSCEWALPSCAGLDRNVYTDVVFVYLDRKYMTTKAEYTSAQVELLAAIA